MIRPATLDDLTALVALAELMHGESRYSVLPFSEGKMFGLLAKLIESGDGCVLVAQKGGQVVGGFVGMVAAHWFSTGLIASDFGLFVHPDHRGGMAAARLLKAFIAWARDKGAAMITAGITTGVHVESTTRLYQALGFQPAGVVFNLEDSNVHRT